MATDLTYQDGLPTLKKLRASTLDKLWESSSCYCCFLQAD